MRKLPVFLHIPKNAGTYINNRAFTIMQETAAEGQNCYHIDVLKEGRIAYRLLCTSNEELDNDYIPLNKICYSVNLEELRLDELNLFMLRISDIGFKYYKKDIYPLLPKNVEPYEFLCLREPYERAKSLYSYLKSIQSINESTHFKYGNKSFIELLNSSSLEGGWLIRSLLNIPNEVNIRQWHFDRVCKILNNMTVFNMDTITPSLNKIFKVCYGINTSNINRKVYDNKTIDKVDTPFDSLDEKTKKVFLNQVYWDYKIYNKYTK